MVHAFTEKSSGRACHRLDATVLHIVLYARQNLAKVLEGGHMVHGFRVTAPELCNVLQLLFVGIKHMVVHYVAWSQLQVGIQAVAVCLHACVF